MVVETWYEIHALGSGNDRLYGRPERLSLARKWAEEARRMFPGKTVVILRVTVASVPDATPRKKLRTAKRITHQTAKRAAR